MRRSTRLVLRVVRVASASASDARRRVADVLLRSAGAGASRLELEPASGDSPRPEAAPAPTGPAPPGHMTAP